MSNYYEIVAALVMAVVITLFFSTVLRSKGPWGAVWLVFITIFLASWAGYLWINPFGPMVLGVSVMPIFVVGLLFAFILAAVSVPQPGRRRVGIPAETVPEDDTATTAIGIFFWIVLIILVVAIVTGYYRMPVNSQQLVN